MSTGTPTLRVAPRLAPPARPAALREPAHPGGQWIRLAAFAALAGYGVIRWAALLTPAPTGRLLGLLAVAVTIAAGVPWLRRRQPAAAIVAAVALVLLALPIAGLPWQYFIHERIALSARDIGNGLAALSGVLVPYQGASGPVVLVITLGAAVLLLDGALVLAFAPPAPSGVRRVGALLPVIALAVVPATLLRPQLPYLQGLILFALLATFEWGGRFRRGGAGAALAVVALAGVAGAIVAPRVDLHKALINYRAWAGTVSRERLDAFDWNQTYGPLHWPLTGHPVLTVRARAGDYWKAEDLDVFTGTAWEAGAIQSPAKLSTPDPSALARWTQNVQVTIGQMRTADVIAAGSATRPSIPQGVAPGVAPGTWTSEQTLGPGTVYQVSTYSPRPSTDQLRLAGSAYPDGQLSAYRTLGIPAARNPAGPPPAVVFAPFHSSLPPILADGDRAGVTRLVQGSPYGSAYALASRLAAHASTPYAFVHSVELHLSRGFAYNQNPPVRRYPLESFLFADKLGYCQQFSGAMAMLLRMGGLPARVAAGFTSGAFDPASHQWTVTDIDAHAWVEVWFPHYGWVRFDPTPAVAPARGGGGQSSLPFDKALPGSAAGLLRAPRRQIGSTPSAITSRQAARPGAASPLPGILAAALALAVVLGLGRVLLRGPPDDEQRLSELERALARSGRPLGGGVTLAALERRFHDSPAAVEYVRSLRLARYAGAGARPTSAQRRAVREQLRLGLGLTGRLRALWALPPRPAAAGLRRRRRGLK